MTAPSVAELWRSSEKQARLGGDGPLFQPLGGPGGGGRPRYPEPQRTKLDRMGAGWAGAIVGTSRLQFRLCGYFWLLRQAPKTARAGSNQGEWLLPVGRESTSLDSAQGTSPRPRPPQDGHLLQVGSVPRCLTQVPSVHPRGTGCPLRPQLPAPQAEGPRLKPGRELTSTRVED